MKIAQTKIINNNVVMNAELGSIISELNGEDILIEFSKLPMKRSDKQNKFFHSVVLDHFRAMFSIEHPVTKEQTKIMLKEMFLMTEIVDFETGEIKQSHRDTSDLNTKEFSQFLDSCRAYYEYHMGDRLPLPYHLDYRK